MNNINNKLESPTVIEYAQKKPIDENTYGMAVEFREEVIEKVEKVVQSKGLGIEGNSFDPNDPATFGMAFPSNINNN